MSGTGNYLTAVKAFPGRGVTISFLGVLVPTERSGPDRLTSPRAQPRTMTTDTFSELTPVGEIAAREPRTVGLLLEQGLDFCCGGNLPLAEACAAAGRDVSEVLELLRGSGSVAGAEGSWLGRDPAELMAHIVQRYHEPLRAELPRILEMAERVGSAHGERPGVAEILSQVRVFAEILPAHMDREEQELFVTGVAPESAAACMGALEEEHVEAGDGLKLLRKATDDFTLPAEWTCNTVRGLWAALEALERDLMEHIHLENNVLHPTLGGA